LHHVLINKKVRSSAEFKAGAGTRRNWCQLLKRALSVHPILPPLSEHVPLLLRAAETGDEMARWTAVGILGTFDPTAYNATPDLINALRDDASSVRETAAEALVELGQAAKEAVPALRQALTDPDKDVQLAALDALKNIDPAELRIEDVRRVVEEALIHERWRVRRSAVHVIESLHLILKEAAVPLITSVVNDKSGEVRLAAVEALGRMGRVASAAAPILMQQLQDKDERVRRACAEALSAVRGNQDAQYGLPRTDLDTP
jgi:HEAT repeat protein